jgi:hypothetical protein
MLPVVNPAVVFRALSDGAVLFSTTDEVYFGLNSVGAKVWQLLPPATATLDQLCTALAAEYPEVAPDTIRSDVIELLEELTVHGLVLPRDTQASAVDESAPRPRYSAEVDGAQSSRVG